MAYDKVIDSAKLDTAMTATANAIRSKSGKTDNIVWDETSGFKSAVEAIEMGGGMQYTTGTVTTTVTSAETRDTEILKVEGLTFTPQLVCIYMGRKFGNMGSNYNVGMVIGGLDNDHVNYDASMGRLDNEASVRITINSDGFVLKQTGSTPTKYCPTYKYIAIA